MDNKEIEKSIKDLQEQMSKLNSDSSKKEYKTPPAVKKAQAKYNKTLKPFGIKFSKSELELWEHLNKQENKSQYIKELIAKDIGYKTGDHFRGLIPTEEFRKEGDRDMKTQKIRSKLSKFNSGQELNDYIENNDIHEREWKEIKRLFCIDENPTGLGYDMFAVGSLPLKAWNKKTIMRKVNDIIENAPFDADIDGDKYTEETLQKKLLKKSPFGTKDSKINKYIDFYKIDDEAILKVFKIV